MLSLLLLSMCFWVFSATASFDYVYTGEYSLCKLHIEIASNLENLINLYMLSQSLKAHWASAYPMSFLSGLWWVTH